VTAGPASTGEHGGEAADPSVFRDPPTARAWDLPTRLFHWSLLTLLLISWISAENGDPLKTTHKWSGYLILSLLLWRVTWGFAGATTARFAAFLPTPGRLAGYVSALLRGRPLTYLGHNPLGALMIVALIALVSLQALSGLALTDDIVFFGPLYGVVPAAITDASIAWHDLGFNLILGFAAVHILANIAYGVFKGENLIGAMISGRKERPKHAFADQQEAVGGSTALAAGLFALSLVIVLGGVFLAAGRL
jgi:cytochrome b